ncbi:MAG: hypothetical protein CMH15_06860 [Mesonia sp.]|nr:hypothetical protein [Mesonia sp.]MAQ40758.1 hypothetical protein [Mesonia sp.]MBJ98463.1 hypothetical protein [Flavobacteriaceae bacterium]
MNHSKLDVFLLDIFEDDYCGKNFNRPAIKEMFEFLNKNKSKVYLFLVDVVDRFSRDTEYI